MQYKQAIYLFFFCAFFVLKQQSALAMGAPPSTGVIDGLYGNVVYENKYPGYETGPLIYARTDISRTQGVAPLTVFFDATATTHAAVSINTFHDLSYEWQFGDNNAGTWSLSGKSKNVAYGAVATHVYETPGVYYARLTVKDNRRAISTTKRIKIVVEDPKDAYPDHNTICLRQNQTGDFKGCPDKGLWLEAPTWAEVIPHLNSNKRVLLRRGDIWTSSAGVRKNVAGPATLGAFGTGNRPVINMTNGFGFDMLGSSDLRIMDLEFMAPTSQTQGNIAIIGDGNRQQAVKDILIKNVKITGFLSAIFFSPDGLTWYDAPEPHKRVAMVDLEIASTGSIGIYSGGSQFAYMGIKMDDFSSHGLRAPYLHKNVIQHNLFKGANMNRTTASYMKLHGPNFNGSKGPQNGKYSELYIISDNIIEAQNRSWIISIQTQNTTTDERIRDVIVERNYFTAGPIAQKFLMIAAEDVTVRNNIFDMSGQTLDMNALGAQKRSKVAGAPDPKNIWSYNNTCYSSGAQREARCMTPGGKVGTITWNNITYTPNKRPSFNFSGETTYNNIVATTNPFISSSPANPADFRLNENSPMAASTIDTGDTIPVTLDFFGVERGRKVAWRYNDLTDIGAIETNTEANMPSP